MIMDWKERKDLKFEWLGEGKEIWKEGFKREKGWKKLIIYGKYKWIENKTINLKGLKINAT